MAAVVAMVLLAGCGSPADSGNAGAAFAVPACIACDVMIGSTGTSAAEPTVAADPNNPLHLVAGSIGIDTTAAHSAGSLWSHVSFDGGLTWTVSRLPGGSSAGPTHPLAGYTAFADPQVRILPSGTVVYVGLAFHGDTAVAGGAFVAPFASLTLFVARSEDGGTTWPDMRVLDDGIGGWAFVGAGPVVMPVFTPGDYHDKPSLAMGPDGTLLLTWTHGLSPPTDRPSETDAVDIEAMLSDDDGKTWTRATTIAQGFFHQSTPVVASDGALHVVYLSLDEETLAYHALSTDRGATWRTVEIGPAAYEAPSMISHPDGRLLLTLALADGDLSVPTLFVSDDDGATWAPGVPLDRPEHPGTPLASVAVDGRRVVYVGFYHATDADGGFEYRLARVEGGIVSEPLVASQSESRPGRMRLHYTGLAGLDEGVFGVWIGGTAPETTVRGALAS